MDIELEELPQRRCPMPRVARALGVTKRTLHRLLAARQESVAAIVDDARAGLPERYLATDRDTISDVSDRLGFAASSAFSRWFRGRFGDQPDRLAGGDHRIRHPDLTGAFCRPAQPGPPRTAACLGCAPGLVSR